MKQQWIIDGQWSHYHQQVAHKQGWALTQVMGMWEVTTRNEKVFATNKDALQHVLKRESEGDPLAEYAVQAVMAGNLGG
jgi:hypothetical protein